MMNEHSGKSNPTPWSGSSNLRNDLVRLRELRRRGKINGVEHYKMLAEILDGSPVTVGAEGALPVYARRLEALIDQRFGTGRTTLRAALSSIEGRAPRSLCSKLRIVIDLLSRVEGSAAAVCAERELEVCRDAIFQVVGLDARPLSQEGTPRPRLSAYAVCGEVRAVRHSDPERGKLQVALADVDGNLVEMWWPTVQTIEVGDKLAGTGLEDGNVGPYHNFSKPPEAASAAEQVIRTGYLSLTKAALSALSGVGCIVAAVGLFISSMQRWQDIFGAWRYVALALLGIGLSCLALWFLILGVQTVLLGRTLRDLIARQFAR